MKRIISSFVVVAAIAISAVVVTSCSNAQAQVGGSVNSGRWEYKIVQFNISESSRDESEANLNLLGKEGWELVSAGTRHAGSASTSEFYGVMKRRLP